MKVLKYGVMSLGGLTLFGIGALFYLGFQSQSGDADGILNGSLAACPPSPNCVSSEAGTPAERKVEPLSLSAWTELPAVIDVMGGTVTKREDAYISAEFSSRIFGFVDDVEFRRTESDIQLRSASRVGYSDAGANAARVAELRERLSR